MAFDLQQTSRPDIAQLLRPYAQSLSETARRRFAAREALTRGHGGPRSIATVLGCAPHTLTDGRRERQHLPADPAGSRVRTPGGGRTKTAVTHADVLHQVQETIKHPPAGDPRRAHVVWTDVPPHEIAQRLQAQSVCAVPRLVRRRLEGLGVARRQSAQGWPGGAAPHRGAPFRHLAHLLQAFLQAGNPVWRIETKKTAGLGTRSRDGTVSGHQARQACEHAVPSLAAGVIMPHGLDDLARHQGWRHGGRSRDTTACAGESWRVCGHAEGPRVSPKASALLLLCAGGGSPSGHTPLGKADLPGVVNDLALPRRVAHSPASGSPCTPIARRLFSHVTRAWQGVLLEALHTVLALRHKTKTPQGRTVTVRVRDTLSQGGRTVREAFKKPMPIVFATLLPKWHYWALPQ